MSNKTKQQQPSTWGSLTTRKRKELLDKIPLHWRLGEQELQRLGCFSNMVAVLPAFLSPMEQAITALAAPELLAALGSGDYTSSEVTSAFGHRATLAHQLVWYIQSTFIGLARGIPTDQ